MEINKLSVDLKDRLLEISEVASDASLTDDAKSSKLKDLKKYALESIALNESQKIGFVAKNFLDDLKKVIESDSWRDIPAPRVIENQFAVLDSLAELLSSLNKSVVQDFSELSRWLEKLLLESAQTANKAKVKAQEREIQETKTQFEEKDRAIEKQFSSAQVSAITAMVVSAVQIVASSASIGVNSSGFFNSKKIKPLRKEAEGFQDEITNLEQRAKILDRESKGLEKSIKAMKSTNSASDMPELARLEASHAGTKNLINHAHTGLSNAKSGLRMKMIAIEDLTSNFQYSTESMRLSNELISAMGKLSEAFTKFITSTMDRDASEKQLAAEKAENRSSSEKRTVEIYDRISSNAFEAISHLRSYLENMTRTSAESMQRMNS